MAERAKPNGAKQRLRQVALQSLLDALQSLLEAVQSLLEALRSLPVEILATSYLHKMI